jgi:hypothetical protein
LEKLETVPVKFYSRLRMSVDFWTFMDKIRTMKGRKKSNTSYNLQDEDNEEEKEKDFSHDPEILDGAPPVAEAPVRVGHDDGQQGRQRPEIN